VQEYTRPALLLVDAVQEHTSFEEVQTLSTQGEQRMEEGRSISQQEVVAFVFDQLFRRQKIHPHQNLVPCPPFLIRQIVENQTCRRRLFYRLVEALRREQTVRRLFWSNKFCDQFPLGALEVEEQQWPQRLALLKGLVLIALIEVADELIRNIYLEGTCRHD